MQVGGLVALFICAGTAAAGASMARSSVHGPEPGHTGGFGEPTCRECHFDGPAHPNDASVTLEGLPDVWIAGRTYPIAVVVSGAALRRGGFQLTVRFAGEDAGRQAGTLAAVPGRVAITVADGVAYAHHVAGSTDPSAPGEVRWVLTWTAPADPGAAVAIHVAANAANDDASEFGDRIVTAADTVPVFTAR